MAFLPDQLSYQPGIGRSESGPPKEEGYGRMSDGSAVTQDAKTEKKGRRRKITSEELRMVRHGRAEELEGTYVGRVFPPGGTRSVWANPFKIGKDGSRGQVVAQLSGSPLASWREKWDF